MTDTPALEERRAALEAVAREVRVCTKCPLHSGRTHAVPGSGRVDADIMFIGEAPGYHEDQQGLPFVGSSGKYLDELLAKIGLRATTCIHKCHRRRPPGNRDPLPAEIEVCTTSYINRQIEIIKPKLIATLGRFSMALFFSPDARISKIHGTPKRAGGRIYYPLYHPAAVLRTPSLRPDMETDFKRLLDLVEAESNRLRRTASRPSN
jgi:DNA polymerase